MLSPTIGKIVSNIPNFWVNLRDNAMTKICNKYRENLSLYSNISEIVFLFIVNTYLGILFKIDM